MLNIAQVAYFFSHGPQSGKQSKEEKADIFIVMDGHLHLVATEEQRKKSVVVRLARG